MDWGELRHDDSIIVSRCHKYYYSLEATMMFAAVWWLQSTSTAFNFLACLMH